MYFFRSFLLLIPALVGFNALGASVNVGLVTELDKYEVYEGLLFHDGHLFVGQLRASENEKHRVEVYKNGGTTMAADLQLDHSVSFIYPYSANEVLVVGRSSYPWKTHYTVISRNGSTFAQRTVTFPEDFQVHEFAGGVGKMYFNEPGSRALYKLTGTRNLTDMNIEVSGPGRMQLDGNILWVLERKSFNFGDENIVMVNTAQNTAKRLFESDRNGISDFLVMDGHDVLAASEYTGNQVVLTRKSSGKIIDEVAISGGPRGLAQIGSCIAVIDEGEKTIHFIYVNGDDAEDIDQWDISHAGDRLKQPRRLAVDVDSGRIYVRSNYVCGSCSVTQSSVFYAEQESRETFEKCLAR